MGGMLCDCGLSRRYIQEWMSRSHRNEKGNSDCSVMRMQSNAVRMTYRNDIIYQGDQYGYFSTNVESRERGFYTIIIGDSKP